MAGKKTVRRRQRSSLRSLAWLCLPTVLLLAAAGAASIWHVPTDIAVDLKTKRIAFKVGDVEGLNLVGSNSQFSRLVIERCGGASFRAEAVEPVSGTTVGWTGTPSIPVHLDCSDPDAKITLESADETVAAGAFDKILLTKGGYVALQVAGDSTPVVTIDLSWPAQLDLPLEAQYLLTTDLVAMSQETVHATEPRSYRVRSAAADRWFHVSGGARRTTLVMTPTRTAVPDLFPDRLRIPLSSAQFLEETSDGLTTSLLTDAKLIYPEYPDVPPRMIGNNDFLLISRTTGLEITRVAVWDAKPGLAITVRGQLREGAIRAPDPSVKLERRAASAIDPRLTVFQVIRYGALWRWLGALIAWGLSTTWIGYERWKKLSE